MKVSLIWAMASNRVIGIENRLPWRLPADMRWFRRCTLGKPVFMGRKTYESFGGKPLPDRLNIVLTHHKDYRAEGAVVVNTIEQGLAAAGQAEELMILGGASFYKQMLPRADRLYVTQVHGDFEGDTVFPEYDEAYWCRIEYQQHDADDENPYPYSFSIYEPCSR